MEKNFGYKGIGIWKKFRFGKALLIDIIGKFQKTFEGEEAMPGGPGGHQRPFSKANKGYC